MTEVRVLVIDDEPQIRRLLSVALSKRGYSVQTVPDGTSAISLLGTEAFDIVLLDLGLPDMDGLDVCRHVRSWSQVPIIVLSVREDEPQKIAALDLGADDYVTKPFSINELLARVRAGLRRASSVADGPVLTFGALTIDLAGRKVLRDGEHIHLTPTEYDLLRLLALSAGRVMTHRHLLREMRGPAWESETQILRVHLVALRQKLGIERGMPGYIVTEPGIGYRLTA